MDTFFTYKRRFVNPYKYKYNGKEWQDELGLNVYGLDWRQYDPAIGRFMTIDPEADELEQLDKSPYAFSWNNPILYNDPDGRNPIKGLLKILKSMADDGIKYAARTSKGGYKPVSTKSADKMLRQGRSVIKTPDGSTNKAAKRTMERSSDGKKVVRHDGHDLPNKQGETTGNTGLPHYQKKSGDGSHVFYDNSRKGVAVGAAATPESTESTSTSPDDKIAGQAASFGAAMTDTVENVGTNVFGDTSVGRFINDINPLNLGLSKFFKAADDLINTKKQQ